MQILIRFDQGVDLEAQKKINRRFPRRRSIECTILKLWEMNAL